ncbi:MAG TPA: hypothetical protein IAA29_02740 [Candidatus Paenibacillus intestinavium]|nr:hypothetical protein [Candidatus Paenibacillus intestinavium]
MENRARIFKGLIFQALMVLTVMFLPKVAEFFLNTVGEGSISDGKTLELAGPLMSFIKVAQGVFLLVIILSMLYTAIRLVFTSLEYDSPSISFSRSTRAVQSREEETPISVADALEGILAQTDKNVAVADPVEEPKVAHKRQILEKSIETTNAPSPNVATRVIREKSSKVQDDKDDETSNEVKRIIRG